MPVALATSSRRSCGRIRSVAVLAAAGEIDARHEDAARRWRADWLIGVAGTDDPDRPRSGAAPDRHQAMLARVAASGRCGAVRRWLGPRAEDQLRLLLIEELSFAEIARVSRPADTNGRKKVAAQAALLLDILAAFYNAATVTSKAS